MSLIWKIGIGLVALYAVVAAVAYLGQRRLIYLPDRTRVPPAVVGLPGVEEHVLTEPDGARLIAWWGHAKPGQPTLLYFHGNAGNLADRAARVERFMAEGWGVFMMAYRGYAGSTGSPSEADNVADAKRAFDWLVAAGVPASDIIIYGESLGTGVAAQVAAERKARGLILEAPYTSVIDVGLSRYPFLPVRAFLLDPYETTKVLPRIHMPLLVLHGAQDRVIPVAMGREVAHLANEPKQLVIFPNGRHSDLYLNGNNAIDAVRAWIAKLAH